MGVFTFILLIVLITTVGKVISERPGTLGPRQGAPQLPPEEIERIRETLDDLSGRLHRLEEERDFYKELLDSAAARRELPPSDESPAT